MFGADKLRVVHASIDLVRVAGLIISVILVLAAVFFTFSTVRLANYARQEEIEILRLVGATKPLHSRSLLYRGLPCKDSWGSGLAAVILVLLRGQLNRFVEEVHFLNLHFELLPTSSLLLFFAGGVALGLVGLRPVHRALPAGMRFLVAIALLAALLGLAPAGHAQIPPPVDPDEGGAALDDVIPERRDDGRRRHIQRRELRRLLDRELSIIETLESLQFQIVKKQDHLEQVQAERAKVEAELAEFQARFEQETVALDEHRRQIRKRLRSMRRLVRMETLFLVFSSDSFPEFLRRERLLDDILAQDRERLVAYKEALVALTGGARTSSRPAGTSSPRSSGDIYESKAEIETDRSDFEELLRRVDQERTYYEKYHEELRRRSRWVARKIKSLDAWDGLSWFDAHKGKLNPPIRRAREAIGFGYRVHPRFGTKVLHRGITYRPSGVGEGVTRLGVYSVYQGKVVFAGHLSGYGNTVIVDHTKGYYTLYAKLSEITVKEGEVLRSRERLGFIGNRRTLRGAELYFELRVDGRPVNPKPWFR